MKRRNFVASVVAAGVTSAGHRPGCVNFRGRALRITGSY
jgi:hypothetical protein